jgi:DNA invertase Pin-like site-specific DNA recombinase
MNYSEPSSRILPEHLEKNAYLYVRQSTIQQVLKNTESTKRQYSLRDHALALGWPSERVITIDEDQGHSGASTADRIGFQRLVSEVSLGRAGIVMGLEVSRLARNNADWQRLLELCAMTSTLIMEDERIFDPNDINDRLLLGIKGTVSETERHLIMSRLQGGLKSRARRGELRVRLPTGFVYTDDKRVVLDPDEEVQAAIRVLFRVFARTGTALAVVRHFVKEGLKFPRRVHTGPERGTILWRGLHYYAILHILHNPRFAGAYAWGERNTPFMKDRQLRSERVTQQRWQVLIKDAHPGYISWADFERNERLLLQASTAWGPDRRLSGPREGPALLQGIVVCGRCGMRMTVRYSSRRNRRVPYYCCRGRGFDNTLAVCQTVPGWHLDEMVGDLAVAMLTPLALQAAMEVQKEIEARGEETDRLRRQHVERCHYDMELARRRFIRVDPDNRLVAAELERDWNERLRAWRDAEKAYEDWKAATHPQLATEEQIAELRRMVKDFPKVWADPGTHTIERKRMVRLLLEDVTLVQGQRTQAHIRFRGGKTESISIAPPSHIGETAQEALQEMNRLLDEMTEADVAAELNRQGMTTGQGNSFTQERVYSMAFRHGFKSYYGRLRAKGWMNTLEVARHLRVSIWHVDTLRKAGHLRVKILNPSSKQGKVFLIDPATIRKMETAT